MQLSVAVRPGWLQHPLRWAGDRIASWIAAERGRFAPWLPVFMGIGALGYFALRAEPPGWIGAASALLASAGALLCRDRQGARALCLAGLALALGFAAGQFATWRAAPLADLPRRAVVLTATVAGVEVLPDERRRVTLREVRLADGAPPLARRIRVRLRAEDRAAPATGDTVRLRALLRPPPPPAYPGAWDLQRDDFFSGLGGYGTALGMLEIVEPRAPGGLAAWGQSVRERIAGRILAALPGARGGIAATLLTGMATSIPEEDRAAFRDSGLAHLLAVAGLHIGIVMGLAMGLARRALALSERASLFWPCKQIAACAALAVGGSYMLLTGMHLPILRSFAMACLVVLGLLLGRRALSLRGLALAAAALLLLSPEQVVGVSFQMSFSAVLALISGYEALRPALLRLRGEGGWRRGLLVHMAMLALTSLLAGTASLPFAAYHFGQVQIYYVVANLLAVPLAAFWVMPAGMAALALMPLGLERLALAPMGWGIGGLIWIGRTVSSWPEATVGVPHMPGWGLALVSLGLAWLGLWRSRPRLLGLAPLLFGLAAPLLARPPDLLVSPDARVIALRAKQGVFVQAASKDRFVEDAFRRFWGAAALRGLPDTIPGEIACGPGGCLVRPRADGPTALLIPAKARPATCDADLVVAAEPARRLCPDAPTLIDRFTVWREGAQAVWLGPAGIRVLTDADARGDRPWIPERGRARHDVAPQLRMALPDVPAGDQ